MPYFIKIEYFRLLFGTSVQTKTTASHETTPELKTKDS